MVFDFGGVLSTSPFLLLPQVERDAGLPEGSIARLLGYGVEEPEPAPGEPYTNPWHLLEIGALPFEEYVAWVREREVEVLGPAAPPLRDVLGGVGGVLALGAHWMVVQRVRRLRDEGYGLAICTNNVREFGADWRSMVPIRWFDVVVDSSEVGLRKPDRRIYELTCAELGVVPERTAFLDDHPGNVEAARRLGMAGILVGADPWAALARLDEVLTSPGSGPGRGAVRR